MNLFALGYSDPAGRTWFLARSAGVGNLLRTDQPLLARSWKHPAEPGMWVRSLPRAVRVQLGGLALHVYPIEAVVGVPVGDRIALSVEGLPPAAPDAPAPPPRGKKEKPTPLFN